MINHNLSAGLKAEYWISAGHDSLKPLPVLEVLEMLHFSPTLFCERSINIQIEMIQAWLFKIGEPEADHKIVIDKCMGDPDALAYFLELANEGALPS